MNKHHKETDKENESEQSNETQEQNTDNTPNDNNTALLQELQMKNAELNDKYLRLFSEFDNFRKRTAKEKIELIQSGGEDVFKNLLPVLDDFERAIKSNTQITDIVTINEGINLIFNKFKNTLTQKGLTEMKTVGEPFNTDLHEAITNVPAPSEELKGKVIDELEKGYLLNGKVIRFAKVVIGN